jgi:hypothetical protein
MTIQYFQPEVWAANLLQVLNKSLVFAGIGCNRDYEGEIAQYGDTVHIGSISDPTIGTYTKDTDITVQALTDADRTLTIDQSKYFAFEVDDIDTRQVRNGGGVMTEAARRAGFGLADAADQFLVQKMLVGAASANALGVVDATTATNVYDKLVVPAGVALDQQNIPTEGRWLIIDPASYGKLLLDTRFIKVNESGTSDGLRNGVVGRAGGFMIAKSNNAFQANRALASVTTVSGAKSLTGVAGQFNQGDVGTSVAGTGVGASAKIVSVSADGSVATTDTNSTASAAVTVTLSGGGQVAVAGSTIGTSYAEQINQVEAFRMEKRFADGLKGLHLYGGKVVRPEALVVASVKVS